MSFVEPGTVVFIEIAQLVVFKNAFQELLKALALGVQVEWQLLIERFFVGDLKHSIHIQ